MNAPENKENQNLMNELNEDNLTISESKRTTKISNKMDKSGSQIFVETHEKGIRFVKELVDRELLQFQTKMWLMEHDIKTNLFLQSTGFQQVFFWVRDETLCVSRGLDESQLRGIAGQIMFVMKFGEGPVCPDRPGKFLMGKALEVGDHLEELGRFLSRRMIPEFRKDRIWPENIKNELIVEIHKFLGSVTEVLSKRRNQTMLYVPNELISEANLTEAAGSQSEKDLVARLETVLNQWTRQIKETLSLNQNQAESDSSGPIEEVQFWEGCLHNLENIKVQLEREDVKQILQVLRVNNNSYCKSFDVLQEQILAGRAEAADNLKFLKILEKPCRLMLTLEPKGIPGVLNEIFFAARLMFEQSTYYSQEERIAGLFRKVSNEVIRRCSDSIILEDLFEGKVGRCLEQLDASIACGTRWKEVYLKNMEIMPRRKKWGFDSDSIFAQIEAFVQRCNDLKEVCEGQIQFGRKGDSPEMPFFSGNKSKEIVSVLEEIKESFEEHLKKLRKISAEQVLDIKSTKWHDDYNYFKVGLKNLDNMYINLINLAFNNIQTVRQGVEYMIAFRDLAKRESILVHLSKKIDRVNELMISELRLAEEFSKERASRKLHKGRFASRAMNIKALLSRVQASKLLYDHLTFVDETLKEGVESEFLKVEGHLRTLIASIVRDFKERYKDLELEVNRRLDQNILIESNDPKNLPFASKVQNAMVLKTRQMQGGRIECNFDKQLLSFMEEYADLRRLGSEGPTNISQRLEDLVVLQKEKLRLSRENVMLVVRDYNNILDHMDNFERSLFQDHIETINNTKARGLKILRWSSQGTLDNFVRECRSKCASVFGKLKSFKESRNKLLGLIEEKCEKLRVIRYDPREVLELGEFESLQEDARDHTRGVLEELFSECLRELDRTYTHFIDKSFLTQERWFNFINQMDIRVGEELQKVVKGALQDFLKTIVGDEKSKTNPAQIFKVFITLERVDNENKLRFEPSIERFENTIKMTLEDLISLFGEFPRLCERAFEARQTRVQRIIDDFNRELKSKRKRGPKKTLGNIFLLNPEDFGLGGPCRNYRNAVSEEVVGLLKEVTRNLEAQSRRLQKQLEPWKKNAVNSSHDSRYMNYVMKTKLPIDNLRSCMEFFDTVQSEIQVEKCSDDSICIYVETSKIKSRLINLNFEKQKSLLREIKERTVCELRELNDKFAEGERQLSKVPFNLRELKESETLLEELSGQKGSFEARLKPLEDKFGLLDDYMTIFKPDEIRMRAGIKENLVNFCLNLERFRERNKRLREEMYEEHVRKVEDFEKEIRDLQETVRKDMPVKNEHFSCEVAQSLIQRFKDDFVHILTKEDDLQFGFKLFEMKYKNIPEMQEIQFEIDRLDEFWQIVVEWRAAIGKWRDVQFRRVDVHSVVEMTNQFEARFRVLSKRMKTWEVFAKASEELDLYLQTLPLIGLLQKDCLRPRHWAKIRNNVKENFEPDDPEFVLHRIMSLRFEKIAERVRETFGEAYTEFEIEKNLQAVVSKWTSEDLRLEVLSGKNIEYVKLQYAEALGVEMEEHLILLGSLKINASSGPFVELIDEWEVNLHVMSVNLEKFMNVQRKFLYFHHIFENLVDNSSELIQERNDFNNIKYQFISFFKRFNEDKKVKRNLLWQNFGDTLDEMSEKLETIQKSMRNYLETIRSQIPRFYFLGDEDIFEILGRARDPECLNKNVKKMFVGISALRTEASGRTGAGFGRRPFRFMESDDGEVLYFLEDIHITGKLDEMIKEIEVKMIQKLKKSFFESKLKVESFGNFSSREGYGMANWVEEFPGQVILVTSQLKWTEECGATLLGLNGHFDTLPTGNGQPTNSSDRATKMNLKRTVHRDSWSVLQKKYQDKLSQLIDLVRKSNNNRLLTRKLVALITVEIHQKDMIESLVGRVQSQSSFEWLRLLRFETNMAVSAGENLEIRVSQGNADLEYGYEYQGNNGRLVVTPTTDRCYLTLTSALHFKRGACPQGPAGTGKTETVKDLGKKLGRFVFVFNCSEGLDLKSLGNMFKGFCQTGFWGCFDEFNRIEVEVLSVIAVQIGTILDAITQEKDAFSFEGQNIHLNRNCAIFITMNPTYAGRSQLPDNLKSLFRPISMMKADSSLICRVTLQSLGFRSADSLCRKIDTLYKLMKEQLTQQKHYDFGLRAIISVLQFAGLVRTENYSADVANEEQFEQRTLIQAIVATNEPKLVSEDLSLFENLLWDLFNDEDFEKDENLDLLKTIDEVMDELGLDKKRYHMDKVVQFYQTKLTQHGNILIGDSMSGKSSIFKVFQETQNRLFDRLGNSKFPRTLSHKINPKVLTWKQLFGFYDQSSEESVLGVFSNLLKTLCEEESDVEKWIILDGPVDTKWIESMNTLLDKNKTLTLMDGYRINLSENVRILFEIDEINQASPATVSRCGMVYLDARELEQRDVRTGWVILLENQGVSPEALDELEALFEKWVEPILAKKAAGRYTFSIPVEGSALIRRFLWILDVFIKHFDFDLNTLNNQEIDIFFARFEKFFLWGFVWVFGACLDSNSRGLFDSDVRDIECLFPYAQTVFDYSLSREKSEFVPWQEKLSLNPVQWQPPADTPFNKFLVETSDTHRNKWFLTLMANHRQNLLCLGEAGTGKSALTRATLGNLEDAFCWSMTCLSSSTSSQKLQKFLENKLIRSSKRKIRPSNNKKMIFLIEDVALAQKDEFGYQGGLELLRQVFEDGQWYDLEHLDLLCEIIDTSYVTTMRTGQSLPLRLLNHLQILFFGVPNDAQIKTIYSSILHFCLTDFDSEKIKSSIDGVVSCMLSVFKALTSEEKLKATPMKPHYVFSMKDLSRLVQSMCLTDKFSCEERITFIRLFQHECLRVFWDQLVSPEDRTLVYRIVNEQIESHLETGLADILVQQEDPVFSSITSQENGYELVQPEKEQSIAGALKEQLAIIIQRHASEHRELTEMVLFNEAIIQVTKISRILKMKGGHVFLLGQGGSGRRTVCRLAALVSDLRLVDLPSGKKYGAREFKQFMKNLFEEIVIKKSRFLLRLEDSKLEAGGILELVNNFLSVGEIPNLWEKTGSHSMDDFANIREKIKIDFERDSEEGIMETFGHLINEGLHIGYVMDMRGERLRRLVRDYSGLIHGTSTVFFGEWPAQAMRQVAQKFLDPISFGDAKVKSQLEVFLSEMHGEVKREAERMAEESGVVYHVTSKMFIQLGELLKELLHSKRHEVKREIAKYSNGLDKLEESKEFVEELKNSIESKRLEIQKKKKECAEIIGKVDLQLKESEKEKKAIELKEREIGKDKEVIQKMTDKTEEKLKSVEPLLAEAEAKIQGLDHQAIAEIKAYLKTKDKRLEYIMFGLMLLLGLKDNWDSVNSTVANANFVKRLKNIDKNSITEPLIKKVEKYTQKKEIDGNLVGFSPAVNTLAQFLRVIEHYVKMNLDITPVKAKVRKLKGELQGMEDELNGLKEKLGETMDTIATLQDSHRNMETEHNILQADYTHLNARLERATKLVQGLSSSKDHWEVRRDTWAESAKVVDGNVIFSAFFLNYLGMFSAEQRHSLVWEKVAPRLKSMGVNFRPGWSLLDFMGTEVEMLQWNFQGLPDDRYSKENGIILKNCRSYPLLLDPQGQGNNWLKNKETTNGLMVVDPKTPDLVSIFEQCVMSGTGVLLQNLGKAVEPVVESILERRVKQSSGRWVMYFLDKFIPFDPHFQFFMTTKLDNPGYSPEISSKVTQINFAVMKKGLEEQLLSVLLKVLDEKLELQRVECIKTKNQCDLKLRDLEAMILEKLETSHGDLVDNLDLIDALHESKEKEEDIRVTKDTNKINLNKNRTLRENYRQIGVLGSEIFFAISKLNKIEHVYQFTLEKYMDILRTVLFKQKAKKEFSDTLREKIVAIDKALRKKVYRTCSGALFEKDQNLLGLLLAVTLGRLDEEARLGLKEEQKAKGDILADPEDSAPEKNYFDTEFDDEMRFLISPRSKENRDNQEVNPDPSWIGPQMWDFLNDLNTLPNFQGIVGSFLHNSKEWRRFFVASEPEHETLPSDWSQKIKGFSLLLVIKVVRPDRLTSGVQKFVAETLGKSFIEPVAFDLEKMSEKAHKFEKFSPILILTNEGVDPWTYVDTLAQKKGKRVIQVSLGKGQSEIAKKKIGHAFKHNNWVYCGNIHLSEQFMRDLELTVESLRQKPKNPEFGLFLSSAPVPTVPLDLLQNCLLCTLEPVRGLKQNMFRVMNTLVPHDLRNDDTVLDVSKYKKLVYALSFFHAVLNERKRFGQLGWNCRYDFSDADFIFNEKIIKEVVDKAVDPVNNQTLQWDALQYLLSEINYGGRVTDQWDRRLLTQYAREIFCEPLLVRPKFPLTRYKEDSEYFVPILEDEEFTSKQGLVMNRLTWNQLRPEFLERVADLPNKEPPEVFGQHINADIGVKIGDSKYFLSSLLKTEKYSNAHMSPVVKISEQEGLLTRIEEALPEPIDVLKVLTRASKLHHDKAHFKSDPLIACLLQEVKTLNLLLTKITADLFLLSKAVQGQDVLSQELELLLRDLSQFQVPVYWKPYISSKSLFSWLEDLRERVEHMRDWGMKGGLITFTLGCFIYPNGFLTAVLQAHSRKTGVSIDSLKFDFSFSNLKEGEQTKPKEGVLVKGLLLQGGKWNTSTNRLVDADPMTLTYRLPIIHFKPVKKTFKSSLKAKFFDCPCYYAPIRQDVGLLKCYLFNMMLPIGQSDRDMIYDATLFVKRGTSIVLTLDD